MAKLIKKQRRAFRFEVKCAALFTFSLLVLLLSSIIVGSMNTKLTINIQKMQNEANVLRADNQQLNIEIQTLQNKDRVYTIAKDAGLGQNQENVISIAGVSSEAE